MVNAEKLRGYLRVDAAQAPDDELNLYINAAINKLTAAGVPAFKNNQYYDLTVLALASLNYDNRGFAFSGTYQQAAEENYRKLINQAVLELRFAADGEAAENG